MWGCAIGPAVAGIAEDHIIFKFKVKQSKNGQLDPAGEGIPLFRNVSNCLPVDMALRFENTDLHKDDSLLCLTDCWQTECQELKPNEVTERVAATQWNVTTKPVWCKRCNWLCKYKTLCRPTVGNGRVTTFPGRWNTHLELFLRYNALFLLLLDEKRPPPSESCFNDKISNSAGFMLCVFSLLLEFKEAILPCR
jgi:hypothetical protein